MTKKIYSLVILWAIFFMAPLLQATDSPVILLMGPPGSGKGTQGVELAKEMNIPHISAGDLFRASLKTGAYLGDRLEECKGYMEKGLLIPDDIILQIVRARLAEPDAEKGYILDGYPRTLAQAESFEPLLKSHQVYVINLDIKDDLLIKRLSGRQTCPDCQKGYNIYFFPPKEANACDSCKTALVQRKDDTQEVIEQRLKTYREQSEPILAFYRKKNQVTDINADQPPTIIEKKILEVVRPTSNK